MLSRLKKLFVITKTVERKIYLSRDEQSAVIGKALDAAVVSATRRGAQYYLQEAVNQARKQGIPDHIEQENGIVYLPVSRAMAEKVLKK